MKTLTLFSLLTFTGLVWSHEMPVTVRDSKQKLVVKNLKVSGIDEALAQTAHFKIVSGTETHAVDLRDQDAEEIKLKTATVLYHLTLARDYFVNKLNSNHVANLPQLTVRIEMPKPFNENLHFIGESRIGEFNNALTVPAASAKALDHVSKWGMEIWFRPMKAVQIDNLVYQAAHQVDQVDVSAILGSMAERAASDMVLQATIAESFSGLDYMGYVSQLLFTVGALEVLPKVLKLATKSIKSNSYLDTAMIPEVIYHEFTHVALSDFISVKKSTPLNEGLSNYFAAVISSSAKIAAKNGDHSKNVGAYNGNAKSLYNSLLETKSAGQTNFVFSFLWQLRERLKSEFKNGDTLADQIIFNARKHVRYADKPIKDDLLPSLRASVSETSSEIDARRVRMILNDVSVKAGL